MGRILTALELAEEGRASNRGGGTSAGEVEIVLEPVEPGSGLGPRRFRSRSILIGRGDHNDFGFDPFGAPTVSSHHAELRCEDEGVFVYDMGSLNGIYKDGRRVRRAALSDGDVFGLGRTGPALRVAMRAVDSEPQVRIAADSGDAAPPALFIEEEESRMTREGLLLRLLLVGILVDAALSLARLF